MDYLVQPRGPGTAWQFRMRTPGALVGKPIADLQSLTARPEHKPDSRPEQSVKADDPRQASQQRSRPPAAPSLFAATIKRGLGTSHLPTAKKLRDELLGVVRRLERAIAEGRSQPLAAIDDEAIERWVEAVRDQDKRGGPMMHPPRAPEDEDEPGLDEPDFREIAADRAERIEQRSGRRPGVQRQLEKFRGRVLRRDETLERALELYLEERAPGNRHGFKPLALMPAKDTRIPLPISPPS